MHTFTIVPLSKEYAQRVRETGRDEFGHSVVAETMTGTGPCRVTLRHARSTRAACFLCRIERG